jgi:hypothetical protein
MSQLRWPAAGAALAGRGPLRAAPAQPLQGKIGADFPVITVKPVAIITYSP